MMKMEYALQDSLELIDARRKHWLDSLGQAVAARRSAFLILPGNVQSVRLLKNLLNISLEDPTGAHDIITLYEVSQSLSEQNHSRLCQAHVEGNLILLIEEFHHPRAQLQPNEIPVVCNVVRRIVPQRPSFCEDPEAPDRGGVHSVSGDFMEVEVFLGRLESGILVQHERASSVTNSQLPELQDASFEVN